MKRINILISVVAILAMVHIGMTLTPEECAGCHTTTQDQDLHHELGYACIRCHSVYSPIPYEVDCLKCHTGHGTVPTPTITVTSPNGGESWQAGTTQSINWSYTENPGDNIKIELLKGGVVDQTITSSTPIMSGSYDWVIPSTQMYGTDYQVRITTTDNVYTDTSDEYFNIVRQIIKILVIPTNYTEGGIYHGIVTQEDLDKAKSLTERANKFFMNSSYNSTYLKFDFNPTITIVKHSNFEDVKDETLEKMNLACKNCYDTILIINESAGADVGGSAYLKKDFPPIVVVPFAGIDRLGTWVHELGHTLGYTVETSKRFKQTMLWDLYPTDRIHVIPSLYTHRDNNDHVDWFVLHTGNVQWWDLMGYGGGSVFNSDSLEDKVGQPLDMSPLSKIELGWLIQNDVGYGTYHIKSIENMNYMEGTPVFKPLIFNGGNHTEYFVAARKLNQPSYGRFVGDRYTALKDGIVIYSYETNRTCSYARNGEYYCKCFESEPDESGDRYCISSISNINNIKTGSKDDPTFFADDGISAPQYINMAHFVKFSVSKSYTESPYQADISISIPDEQAKLLKGVILSSLKCLRILGLLPILETYPDDRAYPDIDIHAYTPDGRHIGMNYVTRKYEMQIPGSYSSGDILNGEEWIFVPKDVHVKYYVDSHDVQKYLEEHPEINPSDAKIEYSSNFMTYGENPQLVTLPDGSQTVGDRTISESVVSTIEPGTINAVYNFTGFFKPINNPPIWNSVKAGSAIPVKFSLDGDQGLDIFATGYPASQKIDCISNIPIDTINDTVTAGSSGLLYNTTVDQYNYIWKTDKAWTNSCRQLTIKLRDNIYHNASFKLQ